MLRLNRCQRKLLADKLGDTANYAAAALVFGQLVSGLAVSKALAAAGFAVWAGFLSFSLLVRKGRL